jgi:hypothetical protein
MTEAQAIAAALERRLNNSSLVLTADVERAAAELRRLDRLCSERFENYRALAQQARRFEAECEALRLKAARYDALAAMAHQTTAYDRLGNGGHWSIGFHSKDHYLSFGEALDAMGKEKA